MKSLTKQANVLKTKNYNKNTAENRFATKVSRIISALSRSLQWTCLFKFNGKSNASQIHTRIYIF